MPALPLDTAGRYVAAAYLVFMVLLIVYVAIMAARLSRIQKDIAAIDELLQARDTDAPKAQAPPVNNAEVASE
ncbi:MAG: hypothetical protein F2799_05925 [Actinobacteria bacterium]|uniref:Unannotated protein n=1 Tax=freshwater metagenome TaxID=449393 RepID=A0A6J7ECD6_9ZZZZ|nr:hypothetical protein [Actinomycetota bacterium]